MDLSLIAFPVEDHNYDIYIYNFFFCIFYVKMIRSSVISVVLKAGGQRLSHTSSTSGAPGAAANVAR